MFPKTIDWYSLTNVLKDIKDLDSDTLCKCFSKLSIEDSQNAGSDSSRVSSPSSLNRASRLFHPSWEGIIQGMKRGVSFEEYLPTSCRNSSMGFSFRFLPGQTKFLQKELDIQVIN